MFFPRGSHERKYLQWTRWAQSRIDSYDNLSAIPPRFRPGGALYPVPQDKLVFQHALLKLYLAYYYEHTIPLANHPPRLVELIELYLYDDPDNPVGEIIEHLSRLRLDFWSSLRRVWEHAIANSDFHYSAYVCWIAHE